MRAILFARATVTSLKGRRSCIALVQAPTALFHCEAREVIEVAPSTSNRRISRLPDLVIRPRRVFETGWLASDINRAALAALSGAWIDRVHARRPQTTIVLDMDSSVSETHGAQEGSAYNGHFGCTCYHPLFVFNQFGDLERCGLRPGNVHSAADWRDVLEPVLARYRHKMKRRYFRGDTACANPGIYEFLEAEGYKYTIRLPTNAVLQQRHS